LDTKPLVSVIITTYKNDSVLSRAIHSVQRQTYPNIEIIVVDDNDPETPARKASEAVMQEYINNKRFRYIKHKKNLNASAARNTGISNASGCYICFLDSDDLYLSRRIEKAVQLLYDNPGIDGVLAGTMKVQNGYCFEIVSAMDQSEPVRTLLLNNGSLGTGSNIFCTQRAIGILNGFDESFERHQDVEFMLRFFSRFKAISIKDIQIVKCSDGHRNIPDYQKLCSIKKHFIQVFSPLISELSCSDKNLFFSGQAQNLLHIANLSGNHDNIDDAIEISRKICAISFKDKIRVTIAKIGLYRLYSIFRKRRIKLRISFSPEDIRLLKTVLGKNNIKSRGL
jgi:glycosyltransferase involved in cell wall biosynthesis